MMNDENILIRALEPEDLEYLYKWENNMDLWEISNTLVPFSHFILKNYIESTAHKDIYEAKQVRLMITDQETKEPLGLIELYDFDPYHQRAGLGVMIYNHQDRRKGYATSAIKLMLDYCFETLGLNQVYSCVPKCNVASLKVFKKIGFCEIGIWKQWLKQGLEWQDAVFFQMLSSDWNS
ncbi:MAG: GNAT family N-acetyltransferase [Odoribacter sp.]|nr:GNAT family N-acetyltransferase [Odoribacter sp.]